MSALMNLIATPVAVISGWIAGLVALGRLILWGGQAAMGSGGTFGSRIGEKFLAASSQRTAFTALRAFAPNIRIGSKLMKAYDNTGTALVTRRADVLDVLANDDDFEVVYGPRMREITGGENFFLGMQPGWDYTRDVSAMRLAARATDVVEIILPRATSEAQAAVAASGGHVDLVQDVGLRVSSDLCASYLGVPGPSREVLVDWTTTLFWYLFADLGADPEFGERARGMMKPFRDHVDAEIARRKAQPAVESDVLGRCLALQAAGTPGMSDEGIRNNLIGLAIGAVPTLSKASALAMEELLRRPDAMRRAQTAAATGDNAGLARIIWEALRFNPHQPVIYRRAVRDTVIARSTLRARSIPRGTMVFLATLSAAFDPLDVPEPGAFRTDRPKDLYMTWGRGMHLCFGDAINRAVIPAILASVLKQPRLRYADGVKGIDTGGTPFPVHMKLAFDTGGA